MKKNFFNRPSSALVYSKAINSKFNNKIDLPEKPKTPVRKYVNVTYSNKRNKKNYWDDKKKKSQEKFDMIKKERYNKEYGEIRKTPKIDENSQKIVSRLLNKNEKNSYLNTNNNITTQYNNKSYFTDYNEPYNIKSNIKVKSRPQTAKKSNVKPLITDIKYKPVIKDDNNDFFYGYVKYDQDKVNDVRNKYHNYLNSQLKNHRNDNDEFARISENYFYYKDNRYSNKTVNVPSELNENNHRIQRIIPIGIDKKNNIINNNNINYNKIINNNNKYKKENYIDKSKINDINIKNDNENINQNEYDIEKINNNENYNIKGNISNYPTNIQSNIASTAMLSIQQNVGSTMPTSNRGQNQQYQTFFNKPIKPQEMKNNNSNNLEYKERNNHIILEQNNNSTINRRTDDLKKFMIFTDNLNLPIHKEKQNKSNSNNKVKQQVFFNNQKFNIHNRNQQSSILKKNKIIQNKSESSKNEKRNIDKKINNKNKDINNYIELHENNFPNKITKEMILANGFVIHEINKDSLIQSIGHQNEMKLNNNSKNFIQERMAHLGTKIKKNI